MNKKEILELTVNYYNLTKELSKIIDKTIDDSDKIFLSLRSKCVLSNDLDFKEAMYLLLNGYIMGKDYYYVLYVENGNINIITKKLNEKIKNLLINQNHINTNLEYNYEGLVIYNEANNSISTLDTLDFDLNNIEIY